MGVEHSLMDTLADIAAGRPTAKLPIPKHGFGGDTPNQKALRCAVWLLQGAPGAVDRCHEFYDEQARRGHCCIGTAVEVLTPSHAQLWYAAAAGHLLGALKEDLDLLLTVQAWWRVETAACGECLYRDREGDSRVLTPGARAWSKKGPQVINSLRDKVIAWLLLDEKPRAGRGSYDVAIPLLAQALSRLSSEDLIGSDTDDLRERFGFQVVDTRAGDGFFAWFTNLEGAADVCYGAGYINGEIILRRDRDEADRQGKAFPREAA